jgi:hypothetical protein
MDLFQSIARWLERRRHRRLDEALAKRLREDEFQRTHEPCPECRAQIPKEQTACPLCGAPFTDAAALQTWRLHREIVLLRQQASAMHARDQQAHQAKSGSNRGCGCILMLGGLIVACIFTPFGGLLFLIGLVLFIVGVAS